MTLKTEPYLHQKKAVEKVEQIKVGALYMEQGTGKTRTALELIAKRHNTGKVTKILWLCPCSVKTTIAHEVIEHVGLIKDLIICGIETLSSSSRTYAHLLQIVKDQKTFLIVDESNLVKNPQAIRTERITSLAEYCQYKLILNGTPITKNETDLFAQWYILDWRILGYKSFWSFEKNHIQYDETYKHKIVRMLNVEYLVNKIAPYTYQVTKDECLDLPDKIYDTFYYKLTKNQRRHYNDVCDALLLEVDEYKPYIMYRLFTAIQNVVCGLHVEDVDEKLEMSPFFNDPLDNPRIQILLEIVERFEDKIIIFCKYTFEINDVIKTLNDKYGKDSAVPFNGEVRQKVRQGNIDKFRNNARFLVANKVTAGYGLNLQHCNIMIYYSNDFNFATRAQSEDRIHRIGQKRRVHIIDICAEKTIDERISSSLSRKENLADSFKRKIDKIKDNKDLKALKEWIDGKGGKT